MNNSFTIADIHRMRYKNYRETKSLTSSELIERTRAKAAPGWARFVALGGVICRDRAEAENRCEALRAASGR